jgi:ElaB/YqjD/DUF883 family membrane-anchored ribosome-binding protein
MSISETESSFGLRILRKPRPRTGGAPTASRSSPTRAQAAFVIPHVYLGTLRSAGCLLERPVFEPTTSLWRNERWTKKALAQRLNPIQALAPAHHTKSRIPSATRSTAEEMALVTLQMKPRNRPDPDLQAIQNDLNSLKDTLSRFMSQASTQAVKSARDATSNFAGQVGDVASDLADRGTRVVSSAGDQAKTFASELETMARRNPLGTLAGAVAIGVLIGIMGRRS